MKDNLNENWITYAIDTDYVVANTNEFGLKEGHKYKVLEVNSCDMVTIEVYEGHTDMYSIEYFDECKF